MFEKGIYVRRRNKLMDQVQRGLILLPGNTESSMNYKDNHYPFRQDSCFLYYFGLDKPGLIGLLDIDSGKEIVFGDEQSVTDITWMGYREPLREGAAKAGITDTRPLSAFNAYLNNALSRQQPVHYLPPYRPEQVARLGEWLSAATAAVFSGVSSQLIKAIVAQRSVKGSEELEQIEKAVNTTAAMQRAAGEMALDGLTEASIAIRLQAIAMEQGGQLSFPTILTVNGQYLHNHYSFDVIREGQLLLCDCGAETGMHYAGDLTRTFPVGGKFSSRQKDIYDIVLAAENFALAQLAPGIRYLDVHIGACEKLADGLKQLGLMKGDCREAVKAGAHALFFPCGLGHMMGLDTHDMENLGEQYVGYTDTLQQSQEFGLRSLRLGRELQEGFVLTVEPGIYMNPQLIDQWEAEKKFTDFICYDQLRTYRDFGGIRIEEDVLITTSGHRVLGDPLGKTAAEAADMATHPV